MSIELELALNMTYKDHDITVECHLHHADITETLSKGVRAVIVACFYVLCVYVREKAHSRCLALVIVFEEAGLVFSDALHLPPPIPVCCWNRKWVLGSVQLLCRASGSHNTLWLCVCL